MKVRELIEKLQALEDQDMEVAASDSEYGFYLIDEPDVRETYAYGYDKVKIVALTEGLRTWTDVDPKYIIKGEPPKRRNPPLLPNTIFQQVFASHLVPENMIIFTNKDNLPADATHVEFKIHDDRKDQNESS
jgi:hypothetical protein